MLAAMTTRPIFPLLALAVVAAGCAHGGVRDTLPVGDRLLSVGGATIAVHVRGQGPVCLVHPGGPGLEWSYLRMPAVEQFLTLVYIEPLGTGASSHPEPAQLTRRRYADDIEGVRAALGLDRVLLLGHSYGGAVAQLYALAHSEHLRGLILYDTTARFDADFGNAVAAGLQRFAQEAWYADAMAAWAAEEKVQSDAETTAVARREMPTMFADWTHRHAEFEPLVAVLHAWMAPVQGSQLEREPFDTRPRLTSLHVPALVIVGRLDPITGVRFAEELHGALAGSQLVVLEHSGHMGHLEEPAPFAAAVHGFLGAAKD
jgi:proline-specific peptidase